MFSLTSNKNNSSYRNGKLSPNAIARNHLYSRFVLYITKILVALGIFLMVIHNMGMIGGVDALGNGSVSWPAAVIFAIGLFVSFLSVPYLYFSSFSRFVKADDFWDEELFWILPSFFFGSFFLYGSGAYSSNLLFLGSVFVILTVHFKFFISAQRMAVQDNSIAGEHQYYHSLQYLTLYYILLIALFVYISPSEMIEAVNKFGY